MKLKTMLIDDEPIALEKLSNYAAKVPFLKVVAKCSNAFEASEYMSDNDVDLIITDINMPDQNGMEFVESMHRSPMIIFTTAYSEYAVDSYKVNSVDYLLKPFRFVDFQRAANRALELYELRHATQQRAVESCGASQSDNKNVYVKYNHRFHRLDTTAIRYIKGFGEYLQIFVEGNEHPITTLSSFPAILRVLGSNFIQVHRSYAVNLDKMISVDRAKIIIYPRTEIPVSEMYREDIRNKIAKKAVLRH